MVLCDWDSLDVVSFYGISTIELLWDGYQRRRLDKIMAEERQRKEMDAPVILLLIEIMSYGA